MKDAMNRLWCHLGRRQAQTLIGLVLGVASLAVQIAAGHPA